MSGNRCLRQPDKDAQVGTFRYAIVLTVSHTLSFTFSLHHVSEGQQCSFASERRSLWECLRLAIVVSRLFETRFMDQGRTLALEQAERPLIASKQGTPCCQKKAMLRSPRK